MKRVGIPRALIYYKFYPLWAKFFEELGAEVVTSPETNKKIKFDSVRLAPNEDCYSTKLFFGHTMAIKDEVDYLFIPRFGGIDKRNVGCPKFIGLAEVMKSMFPNLPEIIKPHFNRPMGKQSRLKLIRLAYKIGLKFTKNPIRILRSINHAIKKYKKHKHELIITEETLYKWENSDLYLNDEPNKIPGEEPVKVALVGHSYVLNDSYASLDIRKILQEFGVDIITSEQMPRVLINKQMKKLNFELYFDYEREILGTIMHFLESKTIDGIIQIMIFSCGPDSIAGELATQFSKRDPVIPVLQLVFDELTAETGLRTRIEAFVDMLRKTEYTQEVYISTKVHV